MENTYLKYDLDTLQNWLEKAVNHEVYYVAQKIQDAIDIKQKQETGFLKTFLTEFQAIDVETGKLKLYGGDDIPAFDEEQAKRWCKENKPYLKVIGQLVAEIPCDENNKPNFDNIVNYTE